MAAFRVFLLSFLSFVVFAWASAHAGEDLRVAYQPSPLYAPLFVAKAKNWVEEELARANVKDMRVSWASFAAGPAMNEAFAAGLQDIGVMGDTPALIGKAAGIDTRIVGLSVSGPKGLGLVVTSKATFSGLKDLKGKKVAVTKGSYAQHFLALALEREGMSFADVEIINMPPADIPAALIAGSIDAGATWEPYIAKFEEAREIRVLLDGTGIKSGVQPVLATADVIKNKRVCVEAFLRAYARGAAFIRENPQAAAELTSKDFHVPSALLQKIFAKQEFAPPINGAALGEFKKAEVYLRNLKLLKNPVDVDAWVDRSFISVDRAKP